MEVLAIYLQQILVLEHESLTGVHCNIIQEVGLKHYWSAFFILSSVYGSCRIWTTSPPLENSTVTKRTQGERAWQEKRARFSCRSLLIWKPLCNVFQDHLHSHENMTFIKVEIKILPGARFCRTFCRSESKISDEVKLAINVLSDIHCSIPVLGITGAHLPTPIFFCLALFPFLIPSRLITYSQHSKTRQSCFVGICCLRSQARIQTPSSAKYTPCPGGLADFSYSLFAESVSHTQYLKKYLLSLPSSPLLGKGSALNKTLLCDKVYYTNDTHLRVEFHFNETNFVINIFRIPV